MSNYFIKVTTKKIEVLDFPKGDVSARDLAGYIGNGCVYIENVRPQGLYTVLNESIWQGEYNEGTSMLVDEEGTFKEDNLPNLLATALCGDFIVGNVLFVGTKMIDSVGIICGFPTKHLDRLIFKLWYFAYRRLHLMMKIEYGNKIFNTYEGFMKNFSEQDFGENV